MDARMRGRRIPLAFTILSASLALLLTAAMGAAAHPDQPSDGAVDSGEAVHGEQHDQHGGTDGHLEDVERNVERVSRLALRNVTAEKIGDVGVLGDYAYLAAWGGATCKYNGVHVVDISDVEQPEEVAFIQAKEGSYPGEGVQALSIDTAAFTGDILVTNNEKCRDTAGFGGMNIYNVTNPKRPTPLTVGFGDDSVPGQGKKDAHEIHSVFAWDAGDRAYAVIVDNEEAADVDIVDITDPKKPTFIAEYDLLAEFPQIAQAGLSSIGLHDMVVKEIGGRFVMLLSYWDGGYVALDVTDPKDPVYLGDTDFADPDPLAAERGLMNVPPEGNAHQAEFTLDDRFFIGADEDFAPYALTAENVTDDTEIDASQGSNTLRLEPGETISGEGVFVGRACDSDTPVPSGGDGTQIAVVERGLCFFTTKVANVIAAGGYEAVLIFNRQTSDGCDGTLSMSVEGDLPTFGVAPRGQGFAIFDEPYDNEACVAGTGPALLSEVVPIGTTGDTLSFSSYFDGWGYVHLFDATTMDELDTYAIPEAHDRNFATKFGDLTVHEVATSHQDAELAYLSYYSGGFRVLEIQDGELVEVGAFVDEGGSNFWGVEVFEQDGVEYVAASDRDFGLYIFRYTGSD